MTTVDIWRGKLLDHEGRIGRLQYLGYHMVSYVLLLLAMAAAWVIYSITAALNTSLPGAEMFGIAVVIIGMIGAMALYVWSSVCISIKRLHDLDMPGWWYLALWLVGVAGAVVQQDSPGLGALCSLVALVGYVLLMVLPGTKGNNRFDRIIEG